MVIRRESLQPRERAWIRDFGSSTAHDARAVARSRPLADPESPPGTPKSPLRAASGPCRCAGCLSPRSFEALTADAWARPPRHVQQQAHVRRCPDTNAIGTCMVTASQLKSCGCCTSRAQSRTHRLAWPRSPDSSRRYSHPSPPPARLAVCRTLAALDSPNSAPPPTHPRPAPPPIHCTRQTMVSLFLFPAPVCWNAAYVRALLERLSFRASASKSAQRDCDPHALSACAGEHRSHRSAHHLRL